MAGLRKLKDKYYVRLRQWNGIKQDEKLIPLKTTNRTEALERQIIVNRYEKDLKNGIEIEFPWMNEKNETKIVRYTLELAIKDYVVIRSSQNLRPKTIEQNVLALKHFSNLVGEKYPVDDIGIQFIDNFIKHCQNYHSITTINMNLRAIKTFFHWLNEHNRIKTFPRIKQLLVNKSLPIYLTDYEFNGIMDLSNLDNNYKQMFKFYRDTGCRLSEPFYARIDGKWMCIDANRSKTHTQREIHLNEEQLNILRQLQSTTFNEHSIKYISKVFKKACISLNIDKHFHCLRHTFAVRRYLETRDIYLVKNEMGHASVTTTEIYAKFSLRKLKYDFPSLVKTPVDIPYNPIRDTDIRDTAHRL